MYESGSDEGIVMVPVPREHLASVYAALASSMTFPDGEKVRSAEGLEDHTGSESTLEGDSVFVDDRNGRWTEEMVRSLHARLNHPGARAVVTMTAEAAPSEITLADVGEATDIPYVQVRAQLGAMSKLAKKLYGKNVWPMSVSWSAGGVANYSMDQRVAGWWLALEQGGASKGSMGGGHE